MQERLVINSDSLYVELNRYAGELSEIIACCTKEEIRLSTHLFNILFLDLLLLKQENSKEVEYLVTK